MSKSITFVTGNANKLKEVIAILSNGADTTTVGDYTIVNTKLDLEEIQGSIEDVTVHKAKQAASIVNGPVMVEDTCLAYTALKDLPGPYIKWFVDALGLEGLVKLLAGFEDKSARSVCTFGYCEGPGKPVLLFQGDTKGKIVDSRGPTNFGFDSIFEPIGFDQTFAEMPKSVKNTISHRYRALDKLRNFLQTGDHSESVEVL